MKENIYNIVQIVIGSLLVAVILLQQKGSGLGGILGGSSNIYSTKRGIDKVLHYTTIVTAVIFFGFSFLRLVV